MINLRLSRSKDATPTAFDASFRFETSWLLPPLGLFLLRALISLYIFVSIFSEFGWLSTNGFKSEARHHFSYFTNLTFWGLGFYFAFSATHTAAYWRRGVPFLAQWPRLLQYMHSLLYSSIVVFPIIVTIVFWAIIFDGSLPTPFDYWTDITKHSLNSVFALTEILIPRTAPIPFVHLIGLIIILVLYLGLAYVTYASQHFYVYDFLNDKKHSRGIVAAYIFGILAACVVVFCIVHLVIRLRIWVVESKLGLTGKRSKQDATAPEAGRSVAEKSNRGHTSIV